MSVFSLNIKYLRKQNKLSQGRLAELIGIYSNGDGADQRFSRANIDSYERGSEPDKEGLRAIANYFSISVDDLLYTDLSKEKAGVNTQKQELIQSAWNVIYVPTFAAGGFGRGFTDMEHWSTFPKEFIVGLPDGKHFNVPVEGDSMYGTYSNGDRAICRPFKFDTHIRWGEVYVIVLKEDQGNIIKRIKKGETKETVTIVSDNKAYQPYQLPINEIEALFICIKRLTGNLGDPFPDKELY